MQSQALTFVIGLASKIMNKGRQKYFSEIYLYAPSIIPAIPMPGTTYQ
jgi:hypothetical protein